MMPNTLVECIPNFSEARRSDVVEKIVTSIHSVPGVQVLDRHSDLDHNRTVITLVGEPTAIEEAAFRSIKTASELINLDEHTGAHPRIGATDVVPFVPISGLTMADCISMAGRLGKRVGEELSIPVYLYEEAATRPERQNLENIRKGQYEGLKVEIETNPERLPDFGPAKLGTAGATVIGARAPLIAFNVYLTTNDLSIAQKIAKAMRNSSGGFRFIKAMGVIVDERAQVSMNMTNFRQTPLARVVEAVRREAQRYGVGIHHSELVGLIPQDAMIDAAVWYTQLDGFKPEQLLENRLFEAIQQTGSAAQPGADFLDQLASAEPTPGGGSAAAYTAAAAAALVAMVGRVTLGKKKYADVETHMQEMVDKAEDLRTRLSQAVIDDAASFEGFLTTSRLPKETPAQQAERAAAMEAAILQAARVPHHTAEMCLKVIKLAHTAASLGNLNAISDALSAAHLASAALKSAAANVRINIHSLNDPSAVKSLLEDTTRIVHEAEELEGSILKIFSERSGIG
jgi:glutamate formiminotransferase / formiminotetrahydrofolate cyclodeaminase